MAFATVRRIAFCVILVLLFNGGSNLEIVQAAEQQLVQVTDLVGKVHAGVLVELTDESVRIEAKPSAISWKREEVLRLDWVGKFSGLLEESPQLLLANADRLGISVGGIDEASLHGSWQQFPAWPEVTVPLETLRGAVMLPQRGILERARMMARIRDQKEAQDVFFLANGDRLAGQLEGLNGKSFQIKTAAGKSPLPAATVQAFGMNPELTSFPSANGPQALLLLEDGSQITVGALKLDAAGILECRAAFGADLQIPLEQMVSLQFLGGRVAYLSDLEASDYVSTPYLTRAWPLQRNLNAIGGPLRLGEREYARGLGLHGQAVVTYDLKGEFASFQATIGVDASTQGRGSVIFRVLTDGKPVFASEIVRGKMSPISVGPLSMQDVKKLTLVSEFADEGDVLDHADWCDALVIKVRDR